MTETANNANTPEIQDNVWYVPFGTNQLISAYDAHPTISTIASAEPFTVSLRTVWVATKPETGFFNGIPLFSPDILILSTSTLGTSPEIQRVHYYANGLPIKTTLNDFLADTIFVCEDYSGQDRLWLKIQVVAVPQDPTSRDNLVASFNTLANTVGAIFPVTLPYTMVAGTMSNIINNFVTNTSQNKPALDCQVDFKPMGQGFPVLRPGNYVVFDQDVNAGSYTLEDNMRLCSTSATSDINVTYAVFTISTDDAPAPEFVTNQRVATLLTQLKDGNANSGSASLDFLTNTLELYGNFKDLQRYDQLKTKDPTTLTTPEKALMQRLSQQPELQPFLPK